MSKSTKKEMGKGIRALLANIETEKAAKKVTGADALEPVETLASVAEVDINDIEVNPFQPRVEFDTESLEELSQSIQTFGVIQPISVRRLNKNKYQIISGERRWRASKLAGLKTLPVYIREADDQGMLEMALLENIQRADLNPLEISLSYQRLIDECDLTHEELSDRLGKKRSSISNFIRLLKLPPMIQQAVKSEAISMGHAKAIAGLEHAEEQIAILDQVLRNHLSVRDTEKLASSSRMLKTKTARIQPVDPGIQEIIEKLSDHLGIKVRISRSSAGKGNVSIPFRSDRELNEIIDSILGQ